MAPSSSNLVPSVAKKSLKLDPEAKNSTKHAYLKERHVNFKKKEAEHLEEANHLSDERSKIDKDAAHILTLITRKWADDLDNLSVNLSSFGDILEDGENFAIP
ncbi:hypothetical protein COLO4_13425 [Corchorus olitorius]|uniref:Uncharacterized protein n=1 Tax=Corchorus olitorius TaxID=93759 RepID=A0A1R3JWK0_9ROSI|nr:hypothetical protein COLO4_13425 [Corchorus olitorius]